MSDSGGARKCRKCGHPASDAPAKGYYANLCKNCRRLAGIRRRTTGSRRIGPVRRAAAELLERAEQFERAVAERTEADARLHAATLDLSTALRAVRDAAQALSRAKVQEDGRRRALRAA